MELSKTNDQHPIFDSHGAVPVLVVDVVSTDMRFINHINSNILFIIIVCPVEFFKLEYGFPIDV